jgi:hypothetical protein
MKILRTILLLTSIASLSACSETTVNRSIDSQIDSASNKIKESVHRVDVDKQINDAKGRIANDPDFRAAGQATKNGLERADKSLSNWLNQPSSTTQQQTR